MLAGRVSAPVLRLAQVWQDFHQARLSVSRLGGILNTAAEPTFSPGRTALPAIRGEVAFEHVTFRYRIDGPEVLHNISFSVPAGRLSVSSAHQARGRARSPSSSRGSTCRRAGECWWMESCRRDHPLDRHRRVGERDVLPHRAVEEDVVLQIGDKSVLCGFTAPSYVAPQP
jgi:hypothetical protein